MHHLRHVIRAAFVLVLAQFAYSKDQPPAVVALNSTSLQRYLDYVSSEDLSDPLSGRSSQCTPGRSTRPSFVCDASALLPSRSIQRIDSEIKDMYQTRSSRYSKAICNGVAMENGYLFEVALVRRLATGPNGISRFARQLFSEWTVGQPQICGNGVLLVISLEDRKFFFTAGRTVQQLLSSSRQKRIENVLVRYLRAQNLYLAILDTVIKTGEELTKATNRGGHGGFAQPSSNTGSYSNHGAPAETANSPWSNVLTLLSIVAGIFLICACCNGTGGKEAAARKSRRQAVARKLQTIKDEYESAPVETRDEELTAKVNELANEFPDIITPQVKQQLLQTGVSSRNYGGVPPPASDSSFSRTSGPAWQSLAGAAGIGALTGWGLSNLFGGNNDGSNHDYSNNNNWGVGGGGAQEWTGGWGNNDSGIGNFFGGWGSNENGGWGGNWGNSGGADTGWGGNWGSSNGGGSGWGGNWGDSGGGGGGDGGGFGGSW